MKGLIAFQAFVALFCLVMGAIQFANGHYEFVVLQLALAGLNGWGVYNSVIKLRSRA